LALILEPVAFTGDWHDMRTVFAGADSGGERAAAMYGLIGTARLNGIDPEAWLRHVLTHIADYPVNRVDDFLPRNRASKLAG
jgi:transposase